MSTIYSIHNIQDVELFYKEIKEAQEQRIKNGKPFKRLSLIVKNYRKPKTASQHKAYWALIGNIKHLLLDNGIRTNEQSLHYYFKRESGFTKMVEMPDGTMEMIVQSISDKSESATLKNLNFLIEFILEWAALNLGHNLELKKTN